MHAQPPCGWTAAEQMAAEVQLGTVKFIDYT